MTKVEPESSPGAQRDTIAGHALWGVERVLRGHYWALAIAMLLLVGNEMWKLGLDPRAWDWLWVSGFVVLFVALRLALELPVTVQQTLDRLANRGLLEATSDAILLFSRRMHEQVRRLAVIWAIVLAVAIVVAWFVAYGPSVLYRPTSVVMQAICAAFAGLFVGRAIGYGRLGGRLDRAGLSVKVQPQHFDGAAGLRPIGQLFFFQASILAVPGAFLAVWWLIIPLYGHYDQWRDAYAFLLALVILLEIFAFVAPLASFHRIMNAHKATLMIEADAHGREAADLRARLAGAEPDQRTVINARLAWLNERYEAIENMPTWPVTARLRRRFTGENALLLVPVVAQVLGLGEPWRQLLEALQGWAS